MEETADEIEIEVRSLMGESTTVSISPNKTILDLKLLLKNSFPPAFTSPNFHLFLKGVKLSLQSQISSHWTESGGFIVLAPFTKKDRQQTLKPNETATTSNSPTQCSASTFADSAWSDMMQDLSSLRNISTNNNQPNIELKTRSLGTHSSATKCKSGFSGDENEEELEKIILSMLQSCENNTLDEKNCERFIQALELRNCLADPISGNCVLREIESAKYLDPCVSKSTMCLCPLWLKATMKAFSFLNIYSAFLKLQSRKITLIALKGLNQLKQFGFQVGIEDLENLSLLFPKVVRFVDSETEGKKLRNSLVIIKSPFQQGDQVETKPSSASQNSKLISKIVNAIKKREVSFKKNLWAAIKSLMYETGNEMVTLEDLLVFVKEGNSSTSAKRARGNCSAPSSTYSFEARCHDTNPLPPVEMVEHLRRGIGSQGQMVHVEEISGRKAEYVEIPSELSENTKYALKRLGITSLYSHQAESIQAILAGKNEVVATMTSSGKSLCYNLPVLEVLSHNFLACALYLFPTKALAQDQLRALLAMTKGLDTSLNIGIYDGDTCQEDRMWLRDNARLVF